MTSNPANNKSQSLPWVNVLKGIAILMVLIVHSTHRFDLPLHLNEICKFGQMGCQIFFVLSAFLIYMSYERHQETIHKYYLRRVISIAPGYWLTIILNILAVLLTLVIYGYSRRAQYFTIENVGANFLLANGLCIGKANNCIVRGGWYIGTTVILYFLFPLILNIYQRIRQPIKNYFPFIVFAIVFLLLFLAGQYKSFLYCKNYSFVYYSFVNQLPCYTLGIVLYDRYKNGDLIKVHSPLLCACLFLVLSLLFFYVEIPYAFVFEPFVFGLSVFYLIVYIVKTPKDYSSWVSRKMRNWGGLSFSVYLIHAFIVYDAARFLTKYVPENWIVWIVWLPIALLIIYTLSIPYDRFICLLQKRLKKIVNLK